MKTKELYNAPEMEQIDFKFEPGIIMGSIDNTEKPIDEGDENF